MSRWLHALRRRLGPDDARLAIERETTAEVELSRGAELDQRFVGRMRELAGQPERAALGRTVLHPACGVLLPVERRRSSGHLLVTGATGSGKTRLVLGVVRQLVERFARDDRAPTLAIVDHKSELADHTKDLVAEVAAGLPPTQAERLLERFAVVDPFSSDALVPFQVLAGEPEVEPAILAYEVTSLLSRLAGDPFGSRQEALTYLALLDGRVHGRSLVEVDRLFANPDELQAVLRRSRVPEVRESVVDRLPVGGEGLAGIRARLQRLLRLRSSRLMLGAPTMISLRECLRGRILVIDTGSPPLGCEDLSRFWSGLLTISLIRAIFARNAAESSRATWVVADEWQEGLRGAGNLANDYERVLAMARSKGVTLALVSQSLAGASAVSATLPRIVATNTATHIRFRASEEDAHQMRSFLPVTGRRLRPNDPWEPARRSPFLTREEERSLLAQEAASLPDRTFYYMSRRDPWPAVLVRANTVEVQSRRQGPAWIRERVERGCLARPIAELERAAVASSTVRGRFVPVGQRTDARRSRRPRVPDEP